jgi:DNA polymerase III delta subunit
MNITDVKVDIKNKKIKPYYIFAGEEIEIQRIYINKIAEVLDYNVVRVDHIADVWAEIISPTLFGKSCVYVVRDDKDLQEDILSAQIEKNNLNGNIIINLLTTVDKRTKFYKANSDKIVLFERLSDEVLKKYIKKEITLNNANCERLIAICESDYSRILLEIDKIKRYQRWLADEGYDKETDNSLPSVYADSVFERLVEDGTIAVPPQDAIFDLVDAILKRQRKRVYDLLEQCYAVGEANMVILSVLYNNAKQVLQVQACEDKDVCGTTGLTSWQVKCAREKCGHYSIDELFNVLKLVQEVQKGIITGQIEDEMSVQYLLVNIL